MVQPTVSLSRTSLMNTQHLETVQIGALILSDLVTDSRRMIQSGQDSRQFVRTHFKSPAAVGGDDSSEILQKAVHLRGMEAPDVWVLDSEDRTATSIRQAGIESIVDVVSKQDETILGEIHPHVVWHRDDPETRRRGYAHIRGIADPNSGAIENIDGFVISKVGDIDDWKKADGYIRVVEAEHGLEAGSLAMSVIIESVQTEFSLADLEVSEPSDILERLFLLVNGEVDYTNNRRDVARTGDLPAWPELRHNTSRGVSTNNFIAVDGLFDDIRDVEEYRERIAENQTMGMLGIWSLTLNQVVKANRAPLPPVTGTYRIEVDGDPIGPGAADGKHANMGNEVTVEVGEDGQYRLQFGTKEPELGADTARTEVRDRLSYMPSLADIWIRWRSSRRPNARGKALFRWKVPRLSCWPTSSSRSVRTGYRTNRRIRRHRRRSTCSKRSIRLVRTSGRNCSTCTERASWSMRRMSDSDCLQCRSQQMHGRTLPSADSLPRTWNR